MLGIREKLLRKKMLTDPGIYATTVVTLVIDDYGTEALSWSPETLRMELQSDYDIELPGFVLDKLAVATMLLTTDEFFKRLSRFVTVCNVLSGSSLNTNVVDLADAAECAWGITEALILAPPDEDEPFTEEIRRYVGKTLDWEGIKNPPDLLRIAIRDTATGLPDYEGMLSDPDLFDASFDEQLERSNEIETMLRENLIELTEQLAVLPLKTGDTSQLADRVRSTIGKAA